MKLPTITVTILDLDEIRAILEEALDAVPEWEQAALRARLHVIMERARSAKAGTQVPPS